MVVASKIKFFKVVSYLGHPVQSILLYFSGRPIDYDPDFRGPLNKRSCTDVICLLMFLAFVAGWGAVGIWGKLNENSLYYNRNNDSKQMVRYLCNFQQLKMAIRIPYSPPEIRWVSGAESMKK